MKYKKLAVLVLAIGLVFSVASVCIAQDKTKPKAPKVKLAPPKLVESETDKTDEISKINPTRDENSPSKLYIPKDLEDVFVELNKMLHPNFIEKFKADGKDAVIKQHFGLGIWCEIIGDFGQALVWQYILESWV